MWKNNFQDIGHQKTKNSDSWKAENKWGEPHDWNSPFWEFLGHSAAERESRWSLQGPWVAELHVQECRARSPRRPKKLELGQSTSRGRAAQRQSLGHLHMPKDATLGQRREHLKAFKESARSSRKARNSACYYQPVQKSLIIHGHWMEYSEGIMKEHEKIFWGGQGWVHYYLDYGDGFMDICTCLKLSNWTL